MLPRRSFNSPTSTVRDLAGMGGKPGISGSVSIGNVEAAITNQACITSLIRTTVCSMHDIRAMLLLWQLCQSRLHNKLFLS